MITPAVSTSDTENLAALRASGLGDVFPGLRITPEARNRPSTLHNTVAVAQLADGATALLYYGRRFHVPPVPYVPAIALDRIRRRLAQVVVDGTAGDLTDEQIDAERLALYADAIAVFGSLARAHGRLHRLVIWLFRINPFANASPGDVMELLGFFSACRSRSGVRSR